MPPKPIPPPRTYPALNAGRAIWILILFFALTLPLMPLQALFLQTNARLARWLPHWYHAQVCRILGIKLKIQGGVVPDRPVLLVANHTSWLDIPVLSAVAPVSFIAKKEIAQWPFVKTLARLQRTVFVDREKRMATDTTAQEIADRLSGSQAIVLFAEGTSSDGNRVLPFRSALFAAAKPSRMRVPSAALDPSAEQTSTPRNQRLQPPLRATPVVQTASIAYTRLHGLPLLRGERALVGWYGDMEMTAHAWALLKAGPLDVEVRLSPPVPLQAFADRKAVAQHSEGIVRETVVRMLRAIPEQKGVQTVQPLGPAKPIRPRSAETDPTSGAKPSKRWT